MKTHLYLIFLLTLVGFSANAQSQINNHHVMFMAGIGTPDATPNFVSSGIGYEYRLPLADRKFGIGGMLMYMNYADYSHLMFSGTGTLHPYKDWFLQTEIGMAHDKNTEGKHKMATLIGIGAGYHFNIGRIAIAPMLSAEYSRIQTPTYSLMICISRHNKCH